MLIFFHVPTTKKVKASLNQLKNLNDFKNILILSTTIKMYVVVKVTF